MTTSRLNVSMLAFAVLAALSLPSCSDPASSTDAHRLVDEGATLLDVRSPAEFQSGHIEGALNIPVDELAGRMDEIPDDRGVVVYCRSGARSGRAATALRGHGYEVHDLGPMSAW